ncbi:recombination-associated protein RdgC [Amantichitinum ursilacus]|uniref:Recombination-associated protein RdgC n=1 Tax=Amantichitinum ursilacus TaxID=857265 RepID=A0A0N0GLD9_9NEIS|nr:recombination-associated protein RdgC [Amantichitinum ursilacus]KPC49781.1 Recombination-associated protein RdgC [Amantichitinum ursilacus]
MLWFRNLQIYRLAPDHALTAQNISSALEKRPFVPCGSSDLMSQGWIAPAAHAPEQYAYPWQDAVLVMLKTEDKLLPGAVIKNAADARVAEIEARENRKVGKREAKEIRERIVDELIPRAFTRSRTQRALIDLQAGLVLVESASASKAEELLSLLRESLGSLPTRLLQTQTTPQTAMTLWLESGDAGDFDLGQDVELRVPADDGAIARLVRQPLSGDEIQMHLSAGKLVTKIAVSWQDRVAFQLTEKLELKRLAMMDTLEEELKDSDAADKEALFNAGLTLLLGELRQLVPTLITALGEEMPA